MAKHEVTMTVNGREVVVDVEPRRLLIDVLRDDLGLRGPHTGCDHGVCGTCTVLRNGRSIRSCTTFAVQADGTEIRTVESLAQGEQLHPMQEAFWEQQGLQCGFCTPGMLMRALEIVEHNPDPTSEEVRAAISGNICRCTGYKFITEAVCDGARRMREDEAPATPVQTEVPA